MKTLSLPLFILHIFFPLKACNSVVSYSPLSKILYLLEDSHNLPDTLISIRFANTSLFMDYDHNEFNSRFGLRPFDALNLSVEVLLKSLSYNNVNDLFTSLSQIQFLRCGNTAVIFRTNKDAEYILIFDKKRKLINNIYPNEVS